MADDTTTTLPGLEGIDLSRLAALRVEQRRINAEIAALVSVGGATTLPTWGPCTRCGHVWQGRSQQPPRHCAGCASAYWDKEPRRSTAAVPTLVPGKKRSRRRKQPKQVEAPVDIGLPGLSGFRKGVRPAPSFSSANDFEAAIRAALPPPPTLTPPPPFLVRPAALTPPPMIVQRVEEMQPESVATPREFVREGHDDATDAIGQHAAYEEYLEQEAAANDDAAAAAESDAAEAESAASDPADAPPAD